MAELNYNGKVVNSVVSELTNLAGKFSPLSNSIKTATGVMVGCRGFNLISDVSATTLSEGVSKCEESIGALVGEIRNQQVQILSFSQDQADIDAFVDSLSTAEYHALDLSGISSKISFFKKAGFVADGVLSSAGTFLLGFGEGVANFAETIGDGVILTGAAASTIFTKTIDLINGTDLTTEMWDKTKAYVAKEQVGSAFDTIYANTKFGQHLKQNAYAFDTVRGIGKGVGYSTALALTTGPSMIATPIVAGLTGVANGTEEAWGNGATTGKGLVYGAAAGAWETVQWGAGMKINNVGKHIDDVGFKAADAFKRVALDVIDSGAEGFVQPALTMIYQDYDGNNLTEKYNNAFKSNGGWNGVFQQAAIGGLMSGVAETSDVVKYKIKNRGRSTSSEIFTKKDNDSEVDTDSKTKSKTEEKKQTIETDETQKSEATLSSKEKSKDSDIEQKAASPKKSESERVSKNEANTKTKTEIQTKPGTKPQAEIQTKSGTKPQAEIQTKPETKIEVQSSKETQIETKNNNSKTLGEKISESRSSLDKMSETLEKRKSELDSAKSKLENYQKTNNSDQKTVESLKNKVETAQQKYDTQKTKVLEKAEEFTNLQAKKPGAVGTEPKYKLINDANGGINVGRPAFTDATAKAEGNVGYKESVSTFSKLPKEPTGIKTSLASNMKEAATSIAGVDSNVVQSAIKATGEVTLGGLAVKESIGAGMNLALGQSDAAVKISNHADVNIKSLGESNMSVGREVSSNNSGYEISSSIKHDMDTKSYSGKKNNSSLSESKLDITGRETTDEMINKIDKAVDSGKITVEQADKIIDEYAPRVEKNDLIKEREELLKAKNANIENKEIIVTKDGTPETNLKGHDTAIRNIDERLNEIDSKLSEKSVDINKNIKSEPGNSSKSLGQEISGARKSLEGMSETLGKRKNELDAAKANLENYQKTNNSDPKVVETLKNKVENAQRKYDLQKNKVLEKAEQFTDLQSQKPGAVGTEPKYKLINDANGGTDVGRPAFTDATAKTEGNVGYRDSVSTFSKLPKDSPDVQAGTKPNLKDTSSQDSGTIKTSINSNKDISSGVIVADKKVESGIEIKNNNIENKEIIKGDGKPSANIKEHDEKIKRIDNKLKSTDSKLSREKIDVNSSRQNVEAEPKAKKSQLPSERQNVEVDTNVQERHVNTKKSTDVIEIKSNKSQTNESKITREFNKEGKVVGGSEVKPDGKSVSYKENSDGTYTKIWKDEKERITSKEYTTPEGATVRHDYKKDGTSTSYTREADGTKITREFNKEGKVVGGSEVKPDGKSVSYKENSDGTYTRIWKDEKERITSKEYTTPEGATVRHDYNKDGTSTSYKENSDGTYLKAKYDSKNNIKNMEWTTTNGSLIKQEFNLDGSSTKNIKNPDGTYSKTEFDALGHIKTNEWTTIDGTLTKEIFDSKGKLQTKTLKDLDGYEVNHTYNSDGTKTTYTKKTNGTYSKIEFDALGNIKTNEWTTTDGIKTIHTNKTDGTYSKIEFDAKNNVKNKEWTTPDGTIRKQKYNPDGTSIRNTKQLDGTERLTKFDKNGNIIKGCEKKLDGTMTEYEMQANGLFTKTKYKNGKILEKEITMPDGSKKIMKPNQNPSTLTTEKLGQPKKFTDLSNSEQQHLISEANKVFKSKYGKSSANLTFGTDYKFKFDDYGNGYVEWLRYDSYLSSNETFFSHIYSKLTDLQKKSICKYIGENDGLSYKTMNGIMRDNLFAYDENGNVTHVILHGLDYTYKIPIDQYVKQYGSLKKIMERNKEAILQIDDAVRQSTLQTDMVTYRGLSDLESSKRLFGVDFTDLSDAEIRKAVMSKKNFVYDGFMSTSATKHSSPLSKAKIVYEIKTKAGTPALDFSKLGGLYSEQEVLITPNVPYNITDVKVEHIGSKKIVHIKCETASGFNTQVAQKLFRKNMEETFNKVTAKICNSPFYN